MGGIWCSRVPGVHPVGSGEEEILPGMGCELVLDLPENGKYSN